LVPWRGSVRRLLTRVLGSAPEPQHSYAVLRKVFNSVEFFEQTGIKRHSHGVAAAHRASVNRFVSSVVTQSGMTQYSFQMSRRDQKEGIKGSREYYWAKDITVEPQDDAMALNDFVSMIDVDYYVDMVEHLSRNPQPHLLYTVQPETAGRICDDFAYCFDHNNTMHFTVSGGAKYIHPVWNYGTDWFTVSAYCFGIPYKTVVYDVTARRTSPDKQVVLLTPMRTTYGLSAILAWWMGKPLNRLTPSTSNGFVKVKVNHGGRKHVSVARVMSETSATVTQQVYDTLVSTKNISPKEHLNLYQVKSVLEKDEECDKAISGPILTDFLNHALDVSVEEVQVTPIPPIVAFAFTFPDPSDKPVLEAFGAPFVPPAFVPVNNKSSSDQSIKGRVIFPRECAEKILGGNKMTETKQKAMDEFLERMVPKPNQHIPMDFEQISERMDKPSQRQGLEQAGFVGAYKWIVTTFMKAEAYGKPTDPRNITQFEPRTKTDYAMYMYPIMDYLKTLPFYAFGKPPLEVAKRVAQIATRAKNNGLAPDISRMDGYVNEILRRLERAFGLRFFKHEFADAFVSAHTKAYGNTGITTHGTRYDQGFSRGSGEMGTSAWNTIENLFMLYYAKYLETRDFDSAWKWLCECVIAGGDDGFVVDLPAATLITAARNVGFIVKVPEFKRGECGVNFLARVYGPDVWNGDPNSMCSLRRQMEKLHLTSRVPLEAKQKLFEKCTSFSFTDHNTPVIGDIVRKTLELAVGYVNTGTITRYGDDWDREFQYPNLYASWMDEVAAEELPLVNIGALVEWVKSVDKLEHLLAPPPFYEEGREFTYDEWDPEPGLLIAKTIETLNVKIPAPKPTKRGKDAPGPASSAPVGSPVPGKTTGAT
jgi:hypothetical protein